MSPVCCCEAKEASAKRIDECMRAADASSKNKGQFVCEIMGCQIIRKGAGQVMPPRDKGTPRARRVARKVKSLLCIRLPVAACNARRPATKTNATCQQKIGTPPEKSFQKFFCPGLQLAARLDHSMERGTEREGPVSLIEPLFSVTRRFRRQELKSPFLHQVFN